MVITLSVKNGKNYLLVQDKNKYKKTTNNPYHIAEFLEYLPKNFETCIISGNDLHLLDKKVELILKDYRKNVKQKPFQYVIENIDSNISVINRKKVKNINVRLISLILSSCVLMGVGLNSKKETTELKPVESLESIEINLKPDEINLKPEQQVTSVILDEVAKPQTLQHVVVTNEADLEAEPVKSVEATLENMEVNYDANQISVQTEIDDNFDLGNRITDYSSIIINDFIRSEAFQYFSKYGQEFNVDPYLLLAISMNESTLNHSETIPGGSFYNGHGIGIMQVEKVHIGKDITAFNYINNQEETLNITSQNIINLETNIKIGAMMFQNSLQRFNGNVYLTLQSYNYGPDLMNMVVNIYAKEIGVEPSEVIANKDDLGWLKYVDDIHNNPSKYISNWEYSTYGNNKYIENVLGYYVEDEIIKENESAKQM